MKAKMRHFRRCWLDSYIDFPEFPRRFDWSVVNVSPTGCQIAGDIDLETGSEVACELTVPECAMEVRIRSKVVWEHDGACGLEFQDIPQGQKLRLAMAIYGNKKAA
jgi:hypothetical protein